MLWLELRCAENPSRMFGKLLVEQGAVVNSDNLLEFACRDCRTEGVRRVLHRFNVLGELVETEYDRVV